ncbi:MAG: glycosyltransferase family 8 protein [Candidatus Heteroscillospira sp.]|jgi:lipopolysaccharide biosynthesis glycosyltransferase
MTKDTMNLLVTFDKHYIGPFKTMLKSLVINNPDEDFHIWLLHSAVPDDELDRLREYCAAQGADFTAIRVERSFFQSAPISKRYPQEMYYRLLAPQLLPGGLKKILYLDPDILVINPLRPLWETELGGCAFAAASHSGLTDVMNDVNRMRLGTNHDYYNSGVMLMDLEKARELVKPEDIFAYVREHGAELMLPDQDVFNALYGTYTKPLPDEIWNYDARYFSSYVIASLGEHEMDWLIRNTAILHFCGKKKPWKTPYPSRFNALYRHYMNLARRTDNGEEEM